MIITPEIYYRGYDKLYPKELTDEVRFNTLRFLRKLNGFLDELGVKERPISSGWRPQSVNKSAKGATRSYHLIGRAADLVDVDGKLAYKIFQEYPTLNAFGLWIEWPQHTKGWVHLDDGVRVARGINTFLP